MSYVIWTRYAHPTGTVTRHVYGLYPSRAKATTERNRMLAHHADYWGADDLVNLEAHVCKILDVESMDRTETA